MASVVQKVTCRNCNRRMKVSKAVRHVFDGKAYHVCSAEGKERCFARQDVMWAKHDAKRALREPPEDEDPEMNLADLAALLIGGDDED